MSSRRPSSGSSRPQPTGRLKPDTTGAHPVSVIKDLTRDPGFAEQIGAMPLAHVAQAIATIDTFNEMVGLPKLYPRLTKGMQEQIDQHGATRVELPRRPGAGS
jgi:hypothetical protein